MDSQSKNVERRRKSSAFAMEDLLVNIRRLPQTQVAFDESHLKQEKDLKEPLLHRIKKQAYCNKKRTWKLLTSYIPLIRYIRYYKLKEYAIIDVLAGLSVGIVHIPQALAFGQLTSVKVENGLFTSVWPVFLYIIFGTSAHISMGTSAVISILTAAIVDRLGKDYASDKPWLLNYTTNGTQVQLDDIPEYLDYKEGISMGVALTCGLMMIALGIFKLGFITFYLSDSFFTAFTSAAAVHIAVSQLPPMFGIKVPRFAGVFKIVKSLEAIFSRISGINWTAFITAVLICIIIQLVKDCINERFKHKLPAPLPIELFVVIFATLISYLANFEENFGVDVVGSIPNIIPLPTIPVEALKESPKYLVDSFILAILIFANTIAMGKVCAKKHNYELDDSQELIAYGMCNAVSSFFKCFPSSVAPPRSMVASNMNAKTTLNGIFAAVIMLMVILVIGSLFTELPKAALAAIIFIALKGLFVQILDGRKYWKINKFDFVIWLFTFVSTVFLDIDVGLGIGVSVSLVTVVFQTQFARGYRLGKTAKDCAFVEHKKYTDSVEIPGLKIFRFQSSLYFANAEIFRSSLYRNTVNPRKLLKFLKKREQLYEKECRERIEQGIPPEPRRNSVMTGENLLVSRRGSAAALSALDANSAVLGRINSSSDTNLTTGNQTERIRKISPSNFDNPLKKISPSNVDKPTRKLSPSNLESPVRKISATSMDASIFTIQESDGSVKNVPEKSVSQNGLNKVGEPPSSSTLRHASMDSTLTLYIDEEEVDEYGEVMVSDEKLKAMRRVHHIIIDCSPINYIDSSGSNVLSHIFTEYGHVNIKVFLAACSADMQQAMEHAGAFQKIPHDHIFLDLADAIAVAKTQKVSAITEHELEDYSDEEATEASYVTRM